MTDDRHLEGLLFGEMTKMFRKHPLSRRLSLRDKGYLRDKGCFRI